LIRGRRGRNIGKNTAMVLNWADKVHQDGVKLTREYLESIVVFLPLNVCPESKEPHGGREETPQQKTQLASAPPAGSATPGA
jgi:hypothetical protein